MRLHRWVEKPGDFAVYLEMTGASRFQGCISCSFRVGLQHMFLGFLRRCTVYFALPFLWAAGTVSSALQPTTALATLGRQAWGMENGLPQNTVSVLLQSRNGFLWVGTELGLARFDGVGFRVFDHATAAPFPDAEIRCLLDSGNGLWAGTGNGLVRWQDGRAVLLTTRDGLPTNSIRGLAQTTVGAMDRDAFSDRGVGERISRRSNYFDRRGRERRFVGGNHARCGGLSRRPLAL